MTACTVVPRISWGSSTRGKPAAIRNSYGTKTKLPFQRVQLRLMTPLRWLPVYWGIPGRISKETGPPVVAVIRPA